MVTFNDLKQMLAKAGNGAVVSCTVDYGKERFTNAPIDEVYSYAISYLREKFELSYKFDINKLSRIYRDKKARYNERLIYYNRDLKTRKRGRWCAGEVRYKCILKEDGKKWADRARSNMDEEDFIPKSLEELDRDVELTKKWLEEAIHNLERAKSRLNPVVDKQEAWKDYLDTMGFTHEIAVYGKDIIIFQTEEQECGDMYREFYLSNCPK